MQQIRYFIVSGRVQGVGFRMAARDTAAGLDLAGWVANRDDGTVELMAGGSAAALDDLYDWLGRGPSAARVDRVEQNQPDGEPELDRPFAVR